MTNNLVNFGSRFNVVRNKSKRKEKKVHLSLQAYNIHTICVVGMINFFFLFTSHNTTQRYFDLNFKEGNKLCLM